MSVAPLSDQARACGLEGSLILDSFKQPLGEKGIVVQQSAHVWIQLQANTLRYEGDACITYIEARAVQNTRYFDRNTATERSGRVLLWSDGGLFVTGVSNHGVTTNKIGRAHVCSPVTNAQLDCRLLLEQKNN